jgi:hypothetical protein
MSSIVNKGISDVVEIFIDKIKEEDTFEAIKMNLIDPTMYHIMDRFYPYLILANVIVLLIIIMLGFLIYNTLVGSKRKRPSTPLTIYTPVSPGIMSR